MVAREPVELRDSVEALLASLEANVELAARTEGERSPIIIELRQIIDDINTALARTGTPIVDRGSAVRGSGASTVTPQGPPYSFQARLLQLATRSRPGGKYAAHFEHRASAGGLVILMAKACLG
jgi:hypothetical protein